MDNNKNIQPFIQWVGGKRKLVNTLANYIPDGLNDYYEPFLGGGALFFHVHHKFQQSFLSDINLELITAYNAVKNNPEQVGGLLSEHEQQHNKEYFYHVRDSNNSNDPYKISARFLYLNKYCFRGIYRINKHGNLGLSYSTRQYSDNESNKGRLKECSNTLNSATIYVNDFSFITAKSNDFVYLDPPYHQSGECFYTIRAFGEADQIRLHDFVKELTAKGVKVMVSNSDTEFIRDLYRGVPREVRKNQLVRIQLMQRLTTSIKATIALQEATNVMKPIEATYQATTQVKVLSPVIINIIEVDAFTICGRQYEG